MPYILPEYIERAKNVDLLTYLQNYEPNELVHFSGNTYTTKTHDSLKISNGLWNWFSAGIGGKNAIDYLVKVKGYKFIEAVKIILNKEVNAVSYSSLNNKNSISKLEMPKKSKDIKIVREYLIGRGIDTEIIDYCIEKEFIFQEDKTNNVIFVGYDNDHIPRYVGCRATNETRFMRDATGSDKNYSFRIISNDKNNCIHIFESAIDLLSYATLLKLKGIDWKKQNFLSLAGVYQPAKIIEQSKVPVALNNFLNSNTNINTLILHLDTDFAGRNATKALSLIMKNDYEIIDLPVPIGKDVNEFLCIKTGINKLNDKERVR